MNSRTIQILKGFIISNFFAVGLIGISKYLLSKGGQPTFVFSEFVIIPILMGMICAWFWKDLNLPGRKRALYACLDIFFALTFSYIFLGEGVICLVIVSPLIFGFLMLGVFVGFKLFKRHDENLNVSVIAILIFVFVNDSLSKHNYQNMVSDTITIHAPPAKVWKNVVAFEKIKQENKYWLFRIGMPSPMQTTVTGYYKGAGRKCIFSNGYTFGEKIITYDETHDLTFDIVDQPRDPEIMNHIDILRGQFLLKDNGNGTTTLTGNSWYKLYVFPTWYYDIWAQSITRNVHLRVMEHIKQISEK
ncbi:hypothetical protein JN11_03557 [Mucilaginibacter frigoritolerans]|uniref:Polyketide cyclase/dehydrase/lipid transport protein n=1 Tax=Mucilaginibacter frigoritolerans TaxID=652788 RepID=A0A562TU83_9SPHI|nr:hypothetical protein [Mucilaginibacter frigoritolerans]TWI97097.1 hypothetical protein JN11_03557 [Mucilaginibacter frigoritolerans]